MYMMGLSNQHASTVPMILNIATGSITPQFYIMCNEDLFATVSADTSHLPEFHTPTWSPSMFGDIGYLDLEQEQEDATIATTNDDSTLRQQQLTNDMMQAFEREHPPQQALAPLPPVPLAPLRTPTPVPTPTPTSY